MLWQTQVVSTWVAYYIGVILGVMEKKIEATEVYWGYTGISEKKIEATVVVYWGYIGKMEKKMEAII